MDIDLLSKMVKELILDNDKVALPGLGCFVAEIVPSAFSDKGYTINPPYRRLSFRSKPDDGDALVDFYAASNGVSPDVARRIITDFIRDLKSVLHSRRMVVFPGLGRMRATKQNNLFFVADENLDIYPAGFGLQPVSLKNHEETREEVTAAVEGLVSMLDVNEDTNDELKENISENLPENLPENLQESIAESSKDDVQDDVQDDTQGNAQDNARVCAKEAGAESVAMSVVPETESVISGQICEPMTDEVPVEATPEPVFDKPESSEPVFDKPCKDSRKAYAKVLNVIAVTVALIFVLLLLFMVLGRIAPDFVDKLLYTSEDLEILNYQFK